MLDHVKYCFCRLQLLVCAGLPQGGIAEAVKQSIECCAQEIQPLLWANILLVGGSTKIQGFKDRLELDLRALAPTEFEINILAAPDPITHSWQVYTWSLCRLQLNAYDVLGRSDHGVVT